MKKYRTLDGRYSTRKRARRWTRVPTIITTLLVLFILVGNFHLFLVEAGTTNYSVFEKTNTIVVVDETRPEIMRKIAECESGDQHYNSEGNVIRGLVDSDDNRSISNQSALLGRESKATRSRSL